jgi:hypothetical protein
MVIGTPSLSEGVYLKLLNRFPRCFVLDMCTNIHLIKNYVGLLYCISDADLDMQHKFFFLKNAPCYKIQCSFFTLKKKNKKNEKKPLASFETSVISTRPYKVTIQKRVLFLVFKLALKLAIHFLIHDDDDDDNDDDSNTNVDNSNNSNKFCVCTV